MLARQAVNLPPKTWWARVALKCGVGYLLASNDDVTVWHDFSRAQFRNGDVAEYTDASRDLYRAAAFVDGRLDGCVFIGRTAPQWGAIKGLFEAEALDEAQRRGLLSGRSTDGLADPGPVICACFGVGVNVIRRAIADGAASVEGLGKALRAGTNCGSCVPELKRILDRVGEPA